MKGWLKSYLLQKSIEALRERGTKDKDEAIAQESDGPEIEQRKYVRVSAKFPVVYEIGEVTLTGRVVNVCDEGMMVESYLPSRRVFETFEILNRRDNYRLKIRCIHGGEMHLREAEVKHFHLHSSGRGPCGFTVGFWIPRSKV